MLPVLARLGLPAWAQGEDAAAFVQEVLRAALQRLQTPADDAAWAVLDGAPAPRIDRPAPTHWQSAALAPPQGVAAQQPSLAQALADAPDAGTQALCWLHAARRWLRRGPGIGLSSLAYRPALLSVTPTHLDLHLPMAALDLRVRRHGLDLDPGWLPWLGQVVHFHYGSGLARP